MAYTYDSDMRLIRDTDIRHIRADVAARGLDVADVEWVVQYDPPQDPDMFGTCRNQMQSATIPVHFVPERGLISQCRRY